MNDEASLSAYISDSDYLRQRSTPRPGDSFYLPLSDLLLFVEKAAQGSFHTALDYGCGGSPYRHLFATTQYIRSDFIPGDNTDCTIDNLGRVPLQSDSCDVILSTQVLEHVTSPRAYLVEANRLLKTKGRLIVTTNGIWEDHPCPYDLWRWTADGLVRQVEDAGFSVDRVCKLTTGPRAILFLLQTQFALLSESRRTLYGAVIWAINRFLKTQRIGLDRWSDFRHSANRVTDAGIAGHKIYIGLGITASKRCPPPQQDVT